MRPLKRPMFRMGGPIKEGIMQGMKNGGTLSSQFNTGLVGDERYPKTGGRENHAVFLAPLAMQGLAAAGRFLAPRAIAAAGKAFGRGVMTKPSALPKPTGLLERAKRFLPSGRFRQTAVSDADKKAAQFMSGKNYQPAPLSIKELIKSPERLGMAVRENPLTSFALAGQIKNIPDIAVGGAKVAGNVAQGAANYLLGTEFGKEKVKKSDDTGLTVVDDFTDTEKSGSVNTSDENKQKIQEDRIEENRKKYYKLMGIDKMKKDAAYDSLIDASRIIQEQGGDLKGAIKSGTLQSSIINAISQNLDKSTDLKRQIDAAILKGEIQKDIASADTTKKRLAEAQIDRLERDAKENTTTAKISKIFQTNKGSITAGETASVLREDNIPYNDIIPDKEFLKFQKNNPGADELDFFKTVGIELDDGRYVVGSRLIEKRGDKIKTIV